MDKESLYEYGNSIIAAIIAIIICACLTVGSVFFEQTKEMIDSATQGNKPIEYENDNAYRAYVEENAG